MAIIRSIFWDQENKDDLIYKFPFNNLAMGSVLTVNESQEALFYKSGVLVEKFTAGRHVLTTSNFPVLSKIIDKTISGGETTFLAEVWFVSKLEKRNNFWGTGNMRVIDPYFQIPIKISARGQYGIRIDDSSLFVKKMVGTLNYASTDLVEEQFRIDVVEAFRVTLSTYMKEQNLNINEVCSAYRGLSKNIRTLLQESFDEYGVELLNFNIENIGFDETDNGYQTVMDGIAEQAKLSRLGINYLQKRQMEIAETAAGNEGAGNAMGIGMGFGVGQNLGAMVNNAMQQSGIQQNSMTPPPPPPSSSYYLAVNGQTTGPFSLNVLETKIQSGEINKSSYVYKVGGTAWTLVSDTPEVMQLFGIGTPPPPPIQ